MGNYKINLTTIQKSIGSKSLISELSTKSEKLELLKRNLNKKPDIYRPKFTAFLFNPAFRHLPKH